jgi:predicted dithiol-disulfide oxidoreductase (DUF899 family)
MADTIPHPKIVSQSEWLAARRTLLTHEKELTKHYDRVAAERRRLPMVKVEKTYIFDTADGKKSLFDLFEGRRQLVIYHFMFGPDWKKGCPGCTQLGNALGDLSPLEERDARFVMVSRAPLEKLEAYRSEKGWDLDWVSSFGSDFNYDYHVTLDDDVIPREYNYRTGAEVDAKLGRKLTGEEHGMSVFFRIGNDVFHTYSAYARGTEGLMDAFSILDITPYGRQQDFEDSPAGWPQKPTYG